MKIAYLVNQYPSVSHSFIRREIQSLEKNGLEIARYAVRSNLKDLVDPGDIEEHGKTRGLLNDSKVGILLMVFKTLLFSPIRFIKAFFSAIKMGMRSDRGVLNHIFYFVEACVVANWVRQDAVDHIHAHFGTNSATLALLVKMLTGTPFSFTVHGPEEFDKPEFLSIARKIEESTFVAAISSFGKSQLFRQIEEKYWDKVKIVHCGLEESYFGEPHIPAPDAPNFVCVGRLCEQKGQLILLRAANELKKQGKDFHLTLVGDGPMRRDLEQYMAAHDLEGNVTITGWMSSDEVKQELIKARAMVLPSFAEGLPVVIMEAMALRRPPITTYIAGIPELVIDGENGWLVTAADVDGLTRAMSKALTTTTVELDAMGEKAHTRVKERHNIETEAAKLKRHFVSAAQDKQ